jgi:CheY-like chemotaxis protein
MKGQLATRMTLQQDPEPIPILYIDDDPEDGQALVTALGPAVVNPVHVFHKAQRLYDYLDMHTGPFIILVDLVLFENMETGGGYDILRNLRQRPDVNNTRSPILAVTGTLADPLLIERVRSTGADAFIQKPVQVDDLVTAIGRPGWFRVELSR